VIVLLIIALLVGRSVIRHNQPENESDQDMYIDKNGMLYVPSVENRNISSEVNCSDSMNSTDHLMLDVGIGKKLEDTNSKR